MPHSVKSYITADLGYCCPYAFFVLYPGPAWTQTVADRLGVSSRSVRACRAANTSCPNEKGCKRHIIARLQAKQQGLTNPSEERSKP